MALKQDMNLILPEEILVEIFDYLDDDSRTLAEFACKRWHEILSTDTRFTKYHKFILHNCTLRMDQPPVSDFMQSGRKIGFLSISPSVRYSGDLSPFWARLGRTLTSLEIKEFSPYTVRSYFLADIIGHFKRLERLRLGTYHMDREMLRTSTGTYSMPWVTVKHLTLDSVRLDPDNYDFFSKMLPNLQTMEIGMYQGSDDEFLKRYLPKIRRLGVCQKYYGLPMFCRIAANPDFNINTLVLALDSASHFSRIAEIAANKPSITRIEVSFDAFPRSEMPNLKKLHLELNEPVMSFQPLAQYQQLEDLEIKLSNYESKCFFGHEVVFLPSLRKFSLYSFASGHCATCHKFMFQSFPNLVVFSYESCFVTSIDVLELISKHLLAIERLTLKYFVTESLKIDGFLQQWKPMASLRALNIKAFGSVTKAGLKNLCSKCPNLEYLLFSGTPNFEQKHVEVIMKKLRRIRCLKIEQRKTPHETLTMNVSYSVDMDGTERRTHCYKT